MFVSLRNSLIPLISLLMISFTNAQTVSTFVGPGIHVDDALIMDTQGNLYGSQYTGDSVYKITPAGEISIYMGGFVSANGLAFDEQGNLFVADNIGNRIYKVLPDSTKHQFGANISSPSGLLFDPLSDTLYVTQYTANRVVKLATDSVVTPFLAGGPLNGPVGLAWDDNHRLYVANFNDGRIFRVTASDSLVELAIIPATNFGGTGFLTFFSGKLYATGIGVHQIFQIDLNGQITDFAGTGLPGGLDGPAASATFNRPNGIYADAAGNRLFISDYGTRAIREITGLVTDIRPGGSGVASENFALAQNYPNPFNPSTTISFALPGPAAVKLVVYNSQGQQVATLIDRRLPSGNYEWDFNASGLASGVYYYQLQAGPSRHIKKMILLK